MILHKSIYLFGIVASITIGRDLWYITDVFGLKNYTPFTIGYTASKCGHYCVFRVIILHISLAFGQRRFWDHAD